MKHLWIIFFATIIALCIWFAFTDALFFIWVAIGFAMLMLVIWYKESAITHEWHEFRIRQKRSGFWFHPQFFGNMVQFSFVCESFERTENETGVHKIVGFSHFYHLKDSVRLGFRRAGSNLNLVLYGYASWKRYKLDLPISIKSGETCTVTFSKAGEILCCTIRNWDNKEGHVEYAPHDVKFGFGYLLYPYGCKSLWRIRK
jgi:hypothetical protein